MSEYGKIVLLYVDIGRFIRNGKFVYIETRVVVSLVRTTLTVQVAATYGPAGRLETIRGCWSTVTRVFWQERGSIRSVSLSTKWPSDGSRQTFGSLSKRRLCLQPSIGYVPETCCGRRICTPIADTNGWLGDHRTTRTLG